MTRFEGEANNFEINFSRRHSWIAGQVIGYDDLGDGYYLMYTEDGYKYIYDSRNSHIPLQPLKREIDPDRMTNDDVKQEIAFRLKRKALINGGLTQTKLSEITGITQPMLHKYFTGQQIPSIINLRKLAKALNCKISDLTGIE